MPSPVVVPGYVEPGYFEGDAPPRAGLRGRLRIIPNLAGTLSVRPNLTATLRVEPTP